jgi:Putative zinc-binding metallo-peptidase
MVNRSMGRDDLYPFVLPTAVLDKMRFIHTMIHEMAFQHVAEAGDARATMEAIADGLEVSSGGESPSHANISRNSAPVMHAAD